MKKHFLTLFIFCSLHSFGQTVIGSANSGAFSGNGLMYSVGEIYVEPETNPDDSNSGLMGILYQVELNVTGVDEILLSDDFRVYPNPTSQILYYNFISGKMVERIFICDMSGKPVYSAAINGNSIDLSYLPAGNYIIKTNVKETDPLKIIKL